MNGAEVDPQPRMRGLHVSIETGQVQSSSTQIHQGSTTLFNQTQYLIAVLMSQILSNKRESKSQRLAYSFQDATNLILLTPNPPPGCFQCSKRRIVCDAIEPSCNKCLKKGLECSGLGRFRFSAGIGRRGRWKDCTIPAVDVSPELAFEKQQFTGRSGPLNIRWKDTNELVNRDRGKRKRVESAVVRDSGKRLRCLEDADRVDGRAEIRETDGIHDIRNVREQDTLNRYTEGLDQSWDFDDIIQREGQLAVQESLHSIPPWIVPLSAQVRKHFSYCNVHPLRPLCYKRN